MSQPLFGRLEQLKAIAPHMDDPPTDLAFSLAYEIAEAVGNTCLPSPDLNLSVDGGIWFEWHQGKYMLIEVYRDGEIVWFTRGVDGNRAAWDLSIEATKAKVLEFAQPA